MATKNPDFSNAKILVVGDVMLDRYWYGNSTRLSPEAPVPVLNLNAIQDRPGGSANVAVNIAVLGAQVSLLALVGYDNEADRLGALLSERAITAHLLAGEQPTICKLRMMVDKHQLLRVDTEQKFIPDDRFYQQYESLLDSHDLVVLSDYHKGTLRGVERLISAATARGKLVLIDPKREDHRAYAGATLITPNCKEFEQWVGPCRNDLDFETKGKALMRQNNWAHLLITRSEQGMTLLSSLAHNAIHLPTEAREVFDVTGAGDTVLATLACMMSINAPIEEGAKFANIAAGIVVSKLGTASVSLAEIFQWQHQHGQSTILSLQELLPLLRAQQQTGKKVVLTNGCFDILHAGHVKYLSEAKSLGDILVVALNIDETVSALKGPTRPVNTLADRMAVIAALSCVDHVIAFGETTPHQIIAQIRPDILVKGGDYQAISEVVGYELVLAYGGEVKVLAHESGASTTNIINKILTSEQALSGGKK